MARFPDREQAEQDPAARLHRNVLLALQALMALELVALLWNGIYMSAFLVACIMALLATPLVLRERLAVRPPYGLQILVILFVFASLFLGEIRSYYDRFWWWDMVLHFSSGLLLGIFGFMLIYILNEDERAHVSVRPGFMALFAFCFAVALGALWEIFEFSMDVFFGMQMQKPMLDDPSGLTDTMVDLMLDALGGAIIAVYGYVFIRRGEQSFIARLIDRLATENPKWFRRR